MTPEARVKAKIKSWYKVNLPGHWRVSPRGGAFGKQGCADDIICWLGFFIAIEVKSETGELTPMQLVNLKEVQAAGGIAAVVKGFDENRLNHIKGLVLHKYDAMIKGLECLSK